MAVKLRILVTLILSFVASAGQSHEFWIEAEDYQAASGEKILARIFNGQNFEGVEMAWFEGRIEHAGWMMGVLGGGFDSRTGDRPAIALQPERPGLLRLIYQSTPRKLTYTEWDKFHAFATGKGNGWAVARHAARGLPPTGFEESYTRFCKALVSVGPGEGADAFTGMEAELVALSNPYTAPHQAGMRVEMRYQGNLLPAAQIDVFEKSAAGMVETFSVTTDLMGQAVVPVKPGYRYLLDSVVLREADAGEPHAWESLWASLTFEVPR